MTSPSLTRPPEIPFTPAGRPGFTPCYPPHHTALASPTACPTRIKSDLFRMPAISMLRYVLTATARGVKFKKAEVFATSTWGTRRLLRASSNKTCSSAGTVLYRLGELTSPAISIPLDMPATGVTANTPRPLVLTVLTLSPPIYPCPDKKSTFVSIFDYLIHVLAYYQPVCVGSTGNLSLDWAEKSPTPRNRKIRRTLESNCVIT